MDMFLNYWFKYNFEVIYYIRDIIIETFLVIFYFPENFGNILWIFRILIIITQLFSILFKFLKFYCKRIFIF